MWYIVYLHGRPFVPTVPSEPLDLTYTNDSSTRISLTWQPPESPNGIIESYTLQITDITLSTDETELPSITDITGNTTEYIVDILLPFHTYHLVLYALTDRGAGPGSVALIVYTLEDCMLELNHALHVDNKL